MDFFEHQDRARKKTSQLVILFTVGMLVTLITVNLVVFMGFWWFESYLSSSSVGLGEIWWRWWESNLNWQVSVGVLSAVAIGTLFRYLELSGGGKSVALWAGGRLVDLNSRDPALKQYINVAEEMAIAAGMSVPELYVMPGEDAINAFVAGYSVDEAVLVVTQGAINHLSRDELQGVIGHEYSHILNGDMRLNIRLMSALAGLIMIGQIGRFLFDSSFLRSRRVSNRDDNRVMAVSLVIGVALMLVGYIGVLVGRVIKASVSRQREFLADASSVQFTRNPEGIAGALFRIKEHAEGSQLHHRHAEDMSHFCFGESVALSSALATHPPIEERIRRVDPKFMPKARARRRQKETAQQSIERSRPDVFEQTMGLVALTAMVGQVGAKQVEYAQSLYRHIPEQVKVWVHQTDGAKAFVYCQMMLANEGVARQSVLDRVKQRDASALPAIKSMWPFAKSMDEQLRYPVLEMALPVLKRLEETDLRAFIQLVEQLVHLDGEVELIEWVVFTLLKRRLAPTPPRAALSHRLDKYVDSLRDLFSVVKQQSSHYVEAEDAFAKVCQRFDIAVQPATSLKGVGFERLVPAIERLNEVSFILRRSILDACADIIMADNKVNFKEYELLRLVAECLDCPMPPLALANPQQNL